ncbi:MAG: hypothetical protein KL787_06670 [Taibaiella sp.]|nr:hypothetical protein [Taibaiella sp.]
MNKKLKWLLILGLLTAIVIYLDACKLGRFVYYNFSDITDYRIFPSRALKQSDHPFHFPIAANPGIPEVNRYFPGKVLERLERGIGGIEYCCIPDHQE